MTSTDRIELLPVSSLKHHPAAEMVPEMRPAEWTAFLEDVVANGVKEPIVVQKGGVILDGRNRHKAAQARGDSAIAARVVEYDETEQRQHILRTALHRRMLSDDQRAMLGTYYHDELKAASQSEKSKKGGRASGKVRASSRTNVPHVGAQVPEIASPPCVPHAGTHGQSDKKRSGIATAEAAREAKVSKKKMRKAIALRKAAPELAQRVQAGEVSLRQATKEAAEQERERVFGDKRTVAQIVKEDPSIRLRWVKFLEQVGHLTYSVNHNGGMQELANKWSPRLRADAIEELTEIRDTINSYIEILEAMK